MALNLNPEIALRLRKSRHRLASTTPIVRRDKNSDEKPDDRPVTLDIAEDLDQILDDSVLKQNQRAIAAHLNDDHYVRRFTPGDFVLSGAAVPTHVVIPAATPRWPAIEMPDGNTSNAVVSWDKPSEWRTGKLKARIWYTSDVGSVNNFLIQITFNSIRAAEVLFGTTLLSTNQLLPGPAVANTPIKAVDVYSTTSFAPDVELFSLRVQRVGADASDTNTNSLDLLYVRVEHIPAQRESQ